MIISIIVFAATAVVVSLVSSTTSSLLIAAVSLLAYNIVDRALEFVFGKKENPELLLEPLKLTSTTPFNPSQFINTVWSSGTVRAEEGRIVENTIRQNQLEARFGIIRFHNAGSDAIGCRVEVRYEAEIHNSDKKIWLDSRYLNWVSKPKRSSLTQMERFNVFEMNKLLANPIEDIYWKQEKDLQVCYTVKGGNSLILCSDFGFYAVPYDENKPSKLKLELTITAQKYPVTKRLFEITADNSSIIFRELKL